MRLLILGGTGFLSGTVAQVAHAAGHEVTVFTRGLRPVPPEYRQIVGNRADAAAFVATFAAHEFDAVIDCICYRADEARAAVAAFHGRTGHYVLISTDFVYGEERTLPIVEDETSTRALNEYGRQKVDCEEIVLGAWRERGFPATVLRPPHLMGAGGHLGTGSLAGRDPMLLDRLAGGHPVVLIDGGQLVIQPVVHRDVAAACLATIGKEATWGQAFNCAGPDVLTSHEYHRIVADLLGVPLRTVSIPSTAYVAAFPDRAPFAQHRCFDRSKLERATGYRPATTVRHAIYEMVDWLQANEAHRPYQPSPTEARIVALARNFEGELVRCLGGEERA